MATLYRFKLLATQCTTAAGRRAVMSPATSPSASPCPQALAVSATTPSKSPSFNLRHHRQHNRRRRTLRRLLSGSAFSSSSSSSTTISRSSTTSAVRPVFGKAAKGRDSPSSSSLALPTAPAPEGDGGDRRGLLSHTSLKDLFVSSPSPPPSCSSSAGGGAGGAVGSQVDAAAAGDWRRVRSPVRGRGGWRIGLDGLSSRRFAGSGSSLRYRLLRRAWRPVLVTIPE